jgi:hypothetical protein
MGSRGRFALICLVLLVSATGSSAGDTASTASALRVPPTEEASIVQSQEQDLSWETQADVRERQMLAWIILLMKDGRGAR